jgi:dienelactone hydrolase
MRFTSETSTDGVREQLFVLGDIPGVLWTPTDAVHDRPLILMGHGGGQHKKAPDIVSRARRFVLDGGFAVAAADVISHGDRPVDDELDRIANQDPAGKDRATLIAEFQALVARRTVPEWRAVVQALDPGPVGYWGVSLGCGLGVPFVAAEPRVRAAVLGLGGAAAPSAVEAAARITVPVEFLVQWDDERVPRTQSLALFDAFASAGKTLHANPGRHGELPDHELDANLAFFRRHLT